MFGNILEFVRQKLIFFQRHFSIFPWRLNLSPNRNVGNRNTFETPTIKSVKVGVLGHAIIFDSSSATLKEKKKKKTLEDRNIIIVFFLATCCTLIAFTVKCFTVVQIHASCRGSAFLHASPPAYLPMYVFRSFFPRQIFTQLASKRFGVPVLKLSCRVSL